MGNESDRPDYIFIISKTAVLSNLLSQHARTENRDFLSHN